MKKIDFGQTIGILANAGVIAGIVLLAFELQQNNELLRAEARFNRNERTTAFAEYLLEPSLAAVLAKVQRAEELNDEEKVQLYGLALRVLRSYEWQFQEFREGALAAPNTAAWRGVFHGEAWVSYQLPETWARAKVVLDPEFVEFMEENVVRGERR